MLWLDAKYSGILCTRFRNFKRVDTYTLNFSCPVCGDSKKNKRKARGYVYKKGDKLNFTCKNCGHGTTFTKFLKSQDEDLYREYKIERFAERHVKSPIRTGNDLHSASGNKNIAQVVVRPTSQSVRRLSDLPSNHEAVQYVRERRIPVSRWVDLFYVPEFFAWRDSMLPGKFEPAKRDEPRLVIPFRDKKGEIVSFQGRQLRGNSPAKYIFVTLKEDVPNVWGWDEINPKQRVYAFEGPIDAMMLPNSVASGGGDITSVLNSAGFDKSMTTVVYDNEPRSENTVKKMLKAFKAGYYVCVWPEKLEPKDANDMIRHGVSTEKLKEVIDNHSFTGLKARFAISQWRKC